MIGDAPGPVKGEPRRQAIGAGLRCLRLRDGEGGQAGRRPRPAGRQVGVGPAAGRDEVALHHGAVAGGALVPLEVKLPVGEDLPPPGQAVPEPRDPPSRPRPVCGPLVALEASGVGHLGPERDAFPPAPVEGGGRDVGGVQVLAPEAEAALPAVAVHAAYPGMGRAPPGAHQDGMAPAAQEGLARPYEGEGTRSEKDGRGAAGDQAGQEDAGAGGRGQARGHSGP